MIAGEEDNGEGEKVTGNQVIRLSGYQAKGETEKGGNGEKKKLTDSPTCPVGSQRLSFGVPRFPDSPIRFQTGFSLLEVMITVVILAFGLLAIMHLFPIGLRTSKISQDTTVASFLAQAKIEEKRNTGWASLSSVTTTEEYGTITGYFQFKRLTIISDEDAVNEPKLKKVVVEVFYKPYGGERSVKLVTLFTNYAKNM